MHFGLPASVLNLCIYFFSFPQNQKGQAKAPVGNMNEEGPAE